MLETAPEGTLYIQVGSDHGSMVLYSAKYGEAGNVEKVEIETTEQKTLKASLDSSDGLSTSSSNAEEEESSNTTIIIVVVVVVLVIAVAVGAVVATKKKKTN